MQSAFSIVKLISVRRFKREVDGLMPLISSTIREVYVFAVNYIGTYDWGAIMYHGILRTTYIPQ